jgi:hypothetical protein
VRNFRPSPRCDTFSAGWSPRLAGVVGRLTMRRPRRTKVAGAIGMLGALGIVLSGCGNQPPALVENACGHVRVAERLVSQESSSSGAALASLKGRTLRQLEIAEPLAAIAAGSNGSWQALQATLQEAETVPVPALLPALRAECSAGASSGD